MLKNAFFNVYTKFKLHFYQEIFRRFQDREASLTTVETFCMETIQALGSPTVNEFATFMRISPPNAAYKVNSLVKKGYIRKVQSPDDRREYHLEVTQKYIDYYNISTSYMVQVMDRGLAHFAEIAGKWNPKADPEFPGTGAAGGLGFAFLTFTSAVLESGIQIVLEETRLREYVKDADLVITGEGRLDGQTVMGKAPVGVARIAKEDRKSVV